MTSAAPIRSPAFRRWLAAVIVAAYLVAVMIIVAIDPPHRAGVGEFIEVLLLLAAFGAFAALGALLIARDVGGLLGPLFAATGVLTALSEAAVSYATTVAIGAGEPGLIARLLVWPQGWYWYAVLAVIFVYVPTLFPDGRLPSPRWRWVATPVTVALVAACVVASLTDMIEVGDTVTVTVTNPLGVAGVPFAEDNPVFTVLFTGSMVGMLMGIASVVVRFRRSRAVERAQIKWFLFAAALLPLLPLAEGIPGAAGDIIGSVLFVVVTLAMPTSIAIAILRYRLFEIDRIISRTLTYAIVVASLAGVYALAILTLGRLAGPLVGGSDLAVAASTLAVAALFGPLRRRVRTLVDRRFNRLRFDGAASARALAVRLRSEVDLGSVADHLAGAVTTALQPSAVTLWLREADGRSAPRNQPGRGEGGSQLSHIRVR